MDFFFIKKMLGLLLMPLPIISLFLLVGLWQLAKDNKGKGIFFTSTSLILLLLTTTPFLADTMLRQKEQMYHQFDLSQPVDYILILGGGHTNDGQIPITAQLAPFSLARVAEGLRIHKQQPHSRFITSGYDQGEPFSNALMNAQMLMAMGIDESKIQRMDNPKDTEEEALQAKALLSGKSFALVTSASHMQRAVRLFKAQGLNPIPAPTEHLVKYGASRDFRYYLPHSRHLKKFERWWYEFLGQQWLSLKAFFK